VRAIALALKAEFGATSSALKTVAQLTRSNERAVRNWLEGKNGPSATAGSSPMPVLQFRLPTAGHGRHIG
jgi:hypothetical protein